MNRENYCPYHHPACSSGCKKVLCRSHFPLRQPVIMESQLSQCESLDHVNCENFVAGNIYREEKRLSKKGCPFLSDHICGHPKDIWCKGNTPPFKIEANNFVESCYGDDFKSCPNYATGIAFQEEANRIKAKLNNVAVS